jgi:hypothetical protein
MLEPPVRFDDIDVSKVAEETVAGAEEKVLNFPSSPTLVIIEESLSVEVRERYPILDFIVRFQERAGHLLSIALKNKTVNHILRYIVYPFFSGILSGWTAHLRSRIPWRHRRLLPLMMHPSPPTSSIASRRHHEGASATGRAG